MADAAVAAGASLLIWSSLPHISKITNGKFTKVHHFDSKAEVEIYIRDLPITSVFFMAGFYMQNFKTMFTPIVVGGSLLLSRVLLFFGRREFSRKQIVDLLQAEDGTYQLKLSWPADTPLPLIDIGDTGLFVSPALLDPSRYHHKRLTAATTFYPSSSLVPALSKAAGREVKYVHAESSGVGIPPEILEALEELNGFMEEVQYYGPTGPEDLKWTLEQIKEKPTTWEKFVEANGPWFDTKV